MGFFDDEENVLEYIRMTEEYDGKELIGILGDHLEPGSTVLELGMGPGKDLDILKKNYTVTGSDVSKVFLDLYRRKYPDADLMELDAVAMDTERRFDCIFSNKVLQHLTKDELGESLRKQRDLLNEGGILFHTLWWGDKTEKHGDLLFVHYTEESIMKMIGEDFHLLKLERYTEMEDADSLYLILEKKDNRQ